MGQRNKDFKKILVQYYILRRKTKSLGIIDSEYPRYNSPIPYEAKEDLTGDDRGQILACIEEEAHFLRIYRVYEKFDGEASAREEKEVRRREE